MNTDKCTSPAIYWGEADLQCLVVDSLCDKGIITKEIADKAKKLLATRGDNDRILCAKGHAHVCGTKERSDAHFRNSRQSVKRS